MFGFVRPSAASGAAAMAATKTIISAILLMPLFYQNLLPAATALEAQSGILV